MRINLKDGNGIDIMVRQEGKLYEYYMGNTRIGVYDPRSMDDNILILQNTLDNELSSQIKDQINQLDRKEIINEAKETKEIEEYARQIGIEGYKIRKIELDNTIEKDNDNMDNENKTKKEDNKKEEKPKNITTKKDVNIKQEIDIYERANDMHSLKKWLGGNIPNDVKKIGVIYSDDMLEMKDEDGKKYNRNSTRYSLVTINNKGEIEPLSKYIPQLKQRDAAGSNPMQGKTQIRNNGSIEKDDAVLSEYEIGNKIIQLDSKEMGEVKMNIGREAHDSTQVATTEVRDSNDTFVSSIKTRKAINGEYSKGIHGIDESLDEMNKHGENCEELEVEDIDGDENTKSHIHLDDEILNQYVSKILENDKIANTYNREDVKAKLLKEAGNGELKEEQIQQVEEEMENSAELEHDMPSPDRNQN